MTEKRTGGALDLSETHGEDLDPYEGGEGHVDVEAEVRGLLVEHLAGVNPGDAGGVLRDNNTDEREHRPAGVLELALAEADDVESLVEGLMDERWSARRREKRERGRRQRCHGNGEWNDP